MNCKSCRILQVLVYLNPLTLAGWGPSPPPNAEKNFFGNWVKCHAGTPNSIQRFHSCFLFIVIEPKCIEGKWFYPNYCSRETFISVKWKKKWCFKFVSKRSFLGLQKGWKRYNMKYHLCREKKAETLNGTFLSVESKIRGLRVKLTISLEPFWMQRHDVIWLERLETVAMQCSFIFVCITTAVQCCIVLGLWLYLGQISRKLWRDTQFGDAFVITDLLWLLVGLALSEQSEALPLASRQGHQGHLVLAAH